MSDGKGYRKWLTKMKKLFEGRKMVTFLEMIREEDRIAKLRTMDLGSTHAEAIEAIYNDKMEKK